MALKDEIAATTEQLKAATTDAEVQKLNGVLTGLSAALNNTDYELNQASASALVQDIANRNDKQRQIEAQHGRVHLDLFTTPHRLTADCQANMQSLAPHSTTSPHDARWDRIPLRDLDRVAAAVLRASTRPGNQQPNRVRSQALPARLPAAKVVCFDQPRAASG